ncbi:MAG: hypothetical protein ABJ308_10020 [Halieaceae bacterium]
MARIFKHSQVEDYFAELDYNQPSEALSATATELYEAGKAVSVSNLKIDCDFAFLSELQFDENLRSNKKFKSLNFSRQYASKPRVFDELYRDTFGENRDRMNYFASQVAWINQQVLEITDTLFPRYDVNRPSVTWRLTDTINENLHLDVYKEDFPDHHVRLFVNLDTVPRIWHTSHTLEHLLQHSLHLVDTDLLKSGTPGRICHNLNFSVFGDMKCAGREGKDKHIVFFDPGEVWFVDSRKVSHQIFFGRKALSTEHQVNPSSMLNPELHYFSIVDRYRKEFLASC